MKCLSRVFQPVITIPKDAKIKSTDITCKSQRLLLECGLVRPTSAGLFALLPLARRALHKLETLVRRAVEARGAQQVSLPALCEARLWARSGRLDASPDLLRLRDTRGRDYLLAPTHEESITDLLADVGPLSHKQLPIILYQISNKYRDEQRPKHGLLRSREFLMMDAYGVHATEECAARVYEEMTAAYRDLFQQLQLPVYRVGAEVGAMGGSRSHEWQAPAGAGEDSLRVCDKCGGVGEGRGEGEGTCPGCGGETRTVASIEVGHTFELGARYTAPLGAHRTAPLAPARAPEPLLMTCYGIGLTRLLAACLEVCSTETALRWPHLIAPYHTLVIGPKAGSAEWSEDISARLRALYDAVTGPGAGAGAGMGPGVGRSDALLDDRDHLTIGKRLLLADRMGYPHVVVMGRAAREDPPRYELHRPGLEPALLTLDELRNIHETHSKKTESIII